MAQFSDSPNLVTENGDGKQVGGALIAREPDLTNYTAMGAPIVAPMWPEQAPSGLDLTKLMHSFRRRWMLALFMGLLLGIPAALATWVILPKQFEVQSILRFRNVESFLGDTGPIDLEKNKRWRESQLVLIKSLGSLMATVREPKVSALPMIRSEHEPISFLQKHISVYSPKDSDLAIVTMTGEDPKAMVEIVRTLTEKYIKEATDDSLEERTKRISLLQADFDTNEAELKSKMENRINLWQTLGATDSVQVTTRKYQLESEANYARSRLLELQRQRSVAREELARMEAKQKALESGDFPEELLMDDIKSDPQLIELRKELADVYEMYQHRRSVAKYPDSDPAVLRARDQYASMKQQEEELVASLRRIALAKIRWENEGPGESLSVARTRVENLDEEVKSLSDQIESLKSDALALSTDSAQLAGLTAEIDLLVAANKDLDERLRNAYLQAKVPPPVEVIEQAEEPEGSTLMYRAILTSFLGLLSFCVGVGGVVLLEYTKQRVSTLNEVGYGGLGLRVLGTVPNLARIASSSKNGEAASSISGILAESIDSVRTMLLSNKRADAPKVILVTSADEHEGKTTVASHLAASLARSGRRTLLVDGDLRKPGIHLLFDMPLSAGLSEVLRGDAEIEAVVHPAQVEGMWVMLAGQCDQRAIASLAKDTTEAIFRTLRADYDFVVVDTGPALTFADTMLMGSHADAAVMAILRDVSQIPKVYEARERLEAIGVPVLGGVVGGIANNGSRNYAVMS